MSIEAQIVAAKLLGYVEAEAGVGRIQGLDFIPVSTRQVRANVCTLYGVSAVRILNGEFPLVPSTNDHLPSFIEGIKIFDRWSLAIYNDAYWYVHL